MTSAEIEVGSTWREADGRIVTVVRPLEAHEREPGDSAAPAWWCKDSTGDFYTAEAAWFGTIYTPVEPCGCEAEVCDGCGRRVHNADGLCSTCFVALAPEGTQRSEEAR